MKRKLGYAMYAAPFVGLAIWIAAELGILAMLGIFGGVAALVAWIGLAVHFMEAA